jgi:hypothetical protein
MSKTAGGVGATGGAGVKDVVSPGELCGFVCPVCNHWSNGKKGGANEQVDTLLSQLETRFDEMSEQVL